MIRTIIKINEEKCIGCGLCAEACHERAIAMVEGKAKLMKDDYCDGLGDCLPVCPTDAISFEEREAAAYDKEAVMKIKSQNDETIPCACPGTYAKKIERKTEEKTEINSESKLTQWPVQIKLVPVKAAYFEHANLLIAADCTAFSYGEFHQKFMKNHVTLIGCPKLDNGEYSEKLCEIIEKNNIKSVTVVRMEVPCCGGLEQATKTALLSSGKFIPWQIVTISTSGEILE